MRVVFRRITILTALALFGAAPADLFPDFIARLGLRRRDGFLSRRKKPRKGDALS
jgi:hypothetical protein